jgi:Reverse transcriptase (RNA-dependent DNA polymerase)
VAKLTLHRLLTQGYFPEELPPPFGTSAFANYLSRRAHSKWPFVDHPPSSRPEVYYLARAGTLRRPLAILNPIQFSNLARFVVTNWDELRAASAKSRISLTAPHVGAEGRALGRRLPFRVLAERRAQLRSGGRFLVRADISRFYQSIYTHSVPWALYGRAFAKRYRHTANVGNQLDVQLRRCQDDQTNGIPIGPDSSLLIAEIILSAIDERLRKHADRIIRYMDDYEIVAETEGEALHLLAELQNELLKFELHLNPSKTGVYPLPVALEQRWTAPLTQHALDPTDKAFKTQVIQFFDTAFDLSIQFPNESVLKYAIGRIANLTLKAEHALVEDLLLQSARIQPGTLALVLRIILANPKSFSRKKREPTCY